MDLGFIQYLIDQYGLVLALLAFAGVNYVLIARRTKQTESKAQEAVTAQQAAVTEQFTALSNERRALQTQLDAVRAELDTLRTQLHAVNDDREELALELASTKRTAEAAQSAQKASDERAVNLAHELENVRVKVMTLETERATRVDELRKETERAAKLEREVTDLRTRVARLEGENSALKQVLDKLNVVSVKPPDHDPPTPPTARVRPMKDEEAA